MKTICRAFLILFLILGGFAQALAAASDWQDLGGGKARIIALKNPETNAINGVIDVRLDPGWKTYWRSPGGSGIPPEFIFTGSKAFKLEGVTFPVPEWIELGGAAFFGYKDHVRFFFTGMAEDVSTSINLDMLIGVCEEICIPATANLSLSSAALNSSDPRLAVELEIAKSKLPKFEEESSDSFQFKFEDGYINAKLLEHDPSKTVRIVIANESGWISDPVEFQRNGSTDYQALIKLPLDPDMPGKLDGKWAYSVLMQDGNTKKVISAVEGILIPDLN